MIFNVMGKLRTVKCKVRSFANMIVLLRWQNTLQMQIRVDQQTTEIFEFLFDRIDDGF